MKEELIENIRSIKRRLDIGVINTSNGTEQHLAKQLKKMEQLVNELFLKEKCNSCNSEKIEVIHKCKCGIEW
jgi:hypothetical protein